MFTSDVIFPNRPYLLFAALVAALMLSSCEEKLSTIGSPYVPDTVAIGAHTFRDSGLRLSSLLKPTVTVNAHDYNLNYSSSYLFLGTVPSEQLESWVILKWPFIPDSVGTLVDDTLILNLSKFFYGPSGSSELVHFSIYTLNSSRISDSTTSLNMSDLSATPIGSYSGTIGSDTTAEIKIRLDSAAVLSGLKTTSLALVLVPEADMTAIRAIASAENGTASLMPTIKLTATDANGTHFSSRTPEFDYHVVTENFVPPAGSFELRGSVAKRQRIVIDTKAMRENLGLSPFVTVNSAKLEFTFDNSLRTTGTQPEDSSYPQLIYRIDTLLVDTVAVSGTFSFADPSGQTISYQIQTFIEDAVRHSKDSLIFELWTGAAGRTFGTTVGGVEDYNLNRWVIYNSDATDPSTRPRLSIIYSYLK